MSGLPLDDVLMGARFLRDLPGFLRHPVTVEEARATLRRRLENRETDFLALAKRAIYEHPPSPYRALLQLAGCEYGDLERLVRHEGVEGALATLLRHGVFLTVDEFRGRRAVQRGALTMYVNPEGLRPPGGSAHMRLATSGSRSPGRPVLLDLATVRDLAVDFVLGLAARGSTGWAHAEWGVPGSAAVWNLLLLSATGGSPCAWFSHVSTGMGLRRYYGWTPLVLRAAGAVARRPLPRPVHVPVKQAGVVAAWMAGVLRSGLTPHVVTFATSAARICQAAAQARLDLRGAQFTVGGEPITPTRLEETRRVGATALPWYGSTEAGTIGLWCLAPSAPDDVHVLRDRLAVVQRASEHAAGGHASGEVFVSSLRETSAPLVLLNVSLGDQGVLVERRCGCPLERFGWTTHLHTVRSFEKLTAGGMTFLDTDLVRVLEEILPARFGGGATDYQLVEEEDATGRPVLRLLVHPRVDPLDEATVREVFLEAIGAGTGAERVMGLVWRDAKLLRVERRPPIPTASGKILHLHVGAPGQGGPRAGT